MTLVPADDDVRQRLKQDFDTTFFVEAGAGTGKTTTLVSRIVAMVAARQLTTPNLVAITFTEAAAAELRARVREGLEKFGTAETAAAAASLEEASIDTIHSFAAALLRTYPLEAGLPPNFDTLDQIEQDLEFRERFRSWFEDAAQRDLPSISIKNALLLGHIELRMAGERMNYLGALAAGGRAVLCFPTHDTEQRPAYPARWLLDAVARLAGRRIGPAELRELRGSGEEHPWLTSLVSTEAALRHGPVMLNLPERRVNEAREIVQSNGDLQASALAARAELPLGRGLAATAARASREFTEFDGNVAAVAPGLTKLAGGLSRLHPISPSGVETWAACPFRYFLGRVLDIEPTERPEDDESWAISAIDRGSLIHAILEEFFRTLLAAARPALAETYTQADRELLEQLARQHFERVESLGQTGYRLAWLNEQTAILLDLRTVLTKDEEFRTRFAVKPEFFEQGFGWAEGWPAAEVALADGTVVRLRGYIDRVDFGAGEAYVTDYKTGSNYGKKDFEDDPVVAGTKVQLAVYSNAVRRFLEERGAAAGEVTASYWFISTKGNFLRTEVSGGEAADTRLAEIMGVVNEGLTAGAFPQVPGEDQGGIPKRPAFANCVFCDYHRICPTGRDQIRERKRDQPGASLHQHLVRS